MRKFIFLFLFLALSSLMVAQSQVIQDFEDPNDSTYWGIVQTDSATDTTRMDMTFQSDNSVEGSALTLDWLAESTEGWGGFVKFEHIAPDSMVYDWSAYDTVSFWYYTETPQTEVGFAHVRLNLYEVSDIPDTTSNGDDTEFYYSFHYAILDDSTENWHKISIPLIAGDYWDGEGFNRTGWTGVAGNEQFDPDQIKGYCFEVSIGGGGGNSEGVYILDQMELSGLAPDPWLIFNGKTVDPNFTQFTWGQSALEIVEGGGIDPKTNSLLWTQGDEWANGWSGAGWDIDPAHDLGYRWGLDSLKFALKAETGTNSPIIIQFESGAAAGFRAFEVDITADDAWHEYTIALSDFYVRDDKFDWDSTNITVLQLMGSGNAIAGKKLWIDFMWTGNPEIDVVPPEAPTSVAGIAGTYQNLITWVDVPNEESSSYNVLYSTKPITSLEDEGLEAVESGIASGVQIATHNITSPATDTEVTYYYAVYAVDAAGNDGALAGTDAVVNTAKAVTAIHPTAPVDFAADGDLSEWANIMPFRMFVDDLSGTVVNNTVIDDDTDLSLNAYVAFDDDYLYFAFDVEDDVIDVDSTDGETWMRDAPDLFIGLYDQHGPSHTGYQRGAEPDYHFRFSAHQVQFDYSNGGDPMKIGADYAWVEGFPSGYTVEGRLSLDTLAERAGDDRFHPVVGMKLPIDYSINDADGSRREGILTYSKDNQDKSWGDVSLWTHTWIGDQMTDVGDNPTNMVQSYTLSQNYPNPFNPSTVINYSLAEAGMVTLKIYNILGQEVLTLVNTNQNVGQYQVKFDASNLSTGLYVYRIQSGDFVATKKMMLLK